ncbi:hypothetical protein C1645_830952 [Glomus cerebriforme]|uniref:Uncharacterized protein n=1 Tax=Glomus cerebriforme TaxID=658196 RepID=A0A397SN15_9GLOM|nr:hypothetical protein C1645_830952 [Glomus cerebriforme]
MSVTTRLATIPDYDGQELPDAYYIKLRNANESARLLEVAGFNLLTRTNLMKSKMTRRFHPVPAQNPYNANANIVTEAEFLNWLQGKYRKVMIGTNRATFKALLSEKFFLHDTPDTYEKRIKPFVQGIAFADDPDVLPYLYDHLPDSLEMRIRIANPGVASTEKLNSKVAFLEAQVAQLTQVHSQGNIQNNDALNKLYILAKRLGLSGGTPKDSTFLDKYITNELIKRLGFIETYLAKLSGKSTRDTESSWHLSDEEDVLDDPMKIDFVRKKKPITSIATVKCKIKHLKIPAMALNSCAKLPIITPDIVERIGYEIDKSIKHDLSGIATVPVESIGKYKCAIDWDKDKLKIPITKRI